MWQEYVITSVTLVLTVSIIPSIIDKDTYIPLRTTGITSLGLLVKAFMFASLGMISPAIGSGFGFLAWALLGYLRSGVRESLHGLFSENESAASDSYCVSDD